MSTHKISVSIPDSLYEFVEASSATKQYKNRSEVFSAALRLLREQQLEAAYHEANSEIDADWDNTIADGIDDETW